MLNPGVAMQDVMCDEMPGLKTYYYSAALGRAALRIWEGLSMDVIFKCNKVISVIQVLAIIEFSVSKQIFTIINNV